MTRSEEILVAIKLKRQAIDYCLARIDASAKQISQLKTELVEIVSGNKPDHTITL